MTTDATQPGVSSNDAADETAETTLPAETTERELSPRERAMQQINASRIQSFEQESGIKLDTSNPDTATASDAPAVTETPAVDDTDTQLAAQLEAPKVLTDGLDQMKVRIKVDGEEMEVSVADMQRQYQKNSAADKRLAEATRRQRELDAREAQLQAQATNTPAPEIDSEVGKRFTAAMQSGDEETASRTFAEAVSSAVQAEMAKGRNAIPDAVTIVQQVKQQLVVESALEQSKKDYPQLYADPDIEALGAAKIQRLMSDPDNPVPFTDALQSVSTEFATKFGWQAAGRQAPTNSTTARDAKLERKAGIDNIPAANVKSTTTEPPPQTHSDVIAEMRNRRPGQAV